MAVKLRYSRLCRKSQTKIFADANTKIIHY